SSTRGDSSRRTNPQPSNRLETNGRLAATADLPCTTLPRGTGRPACAPPCPSVGESSAAAPEGSMNRLGGRALVIGGGIAGLITARVLSDYFDQVVILERDAGEDRPVLHRSVPQGHHLHAMLQGARMCSSRCTPPSGSNCVGWGRRGWRWAETSPGTCP